MNPFRSQTSLSGLTWAVKEPDEQVVQRLTARLGVSDIVARVLVGRGIAPDDADSFLYPTLKNHLPNPLTLTDMERAAARIADAVCAGGPIGVMGDYDVDGATSTAILKLFLEKCGAPVLTFIPEREDGYGPNAGKMAEFKAAGCALVITADCGTTSFEAVEAGNACGLDVVILDHHDAEAKLPPAYAVVNPKRLDEDTGHPCRHLAAVGVVFLAVIAVNTMLRNRGFYAGKTEPNLMSFLDLVALGTVCDVVKLQGINRLLVKAGLNQMRLGQNQGIAALARLVNLSEPPTTYHLGYIFGPRINACGRVGKSDTGMRLLTCADAVTADILARELEDLNALRRDIESEVYLAAVAQVEQNPPQHPFIVVRGDGWHQGVVGIVAGRLKERYNLPVFALSVDGNEVKGSSRSVTGVDLGTLVMNALGKGILSRGGGHPMAAGFTLKKENLPAFEQYLTEQITPEKCRAAPSILEADGILHMNGITPELAADIDKIAPFGEANPEPKFIVKDVNIIRTTLLKNGHISCILSAADGGATIQSIAFRAEDTPMGRVMLAPKGQRVHIFGTLKKDSWRGREKIQIQIIDMMAAD
ncbi:MAG: single-stranded-DNA-specific exonuclease RecJ [Alphaproteobacteria bacterium]|nr:single-stranded-DNA-specific exonuclease RecJ [Alphaproteobacteria bacterium]